MNNFINTENENTTVIKKLNIAVIPKYVNIVVIPDVKNNNDAVITEINATTTTISNELITSNFDINNAKHNQNVRNHAYRLNVNTITHACATNAITALDMQLSATNTHGNIATNEPLTTANRINANTKTILNSFVCIESHDTVTRVPFTIKPR